MVCFVFVASLWFLSVSLLAVWIKLKRIGKGADNLGVGELMTISMMSWSGIAVLVYSEVSKALDSFLLGLSAAMILAAILNFGFLKLYKITKPIVLAMMSVEILVIMQAIFTGEIVKALIFYNIATIVVGAIMYLLAGPLYKVATKIELLARRKFNPNLLSDKEPQ